MPLSQEMIKIVNDCVDKLEGEKGLKEAIKRTLLVSFDQTTTNQRLKEKLSILFEYEKNYLTLIKEFKEELKFIGSLQEDLRKERSKFFAETLKEVSGTLKEAQVSSDVASKWVEDLVGSYTKSLDVSSSLIEEHTFDTIGEIRKSAKISADIVKNSNDES